MSTGILYLIPTLLGGEDVSAAIPEGTRSKIQQLDTFVVENPKSARQFLKYAGTLRPLQEITLLTLDEHTPAGEIDALLTPLRQGKSVGMLSEAGAPAVADPGAQLVRLAHRHNIRVIPLTGPSSLLLALMASGLNGQRFSFLGYLPAEKGQRREKLREIEKHSAKHQETQIFIETPYRNNHLLQDILECCSGETELAIAAEVTLPDEFIHTRKLSAWKNQLPDLHKKPAVFLLLARNTGNSGRSK